MRGSAVRAAVVMALCAVVVTGCTAGPARTPRTPDGARPPASLAEIPSGRPASRRSGAALGRRPDDRPIWVPARSRDERRRATEQQGGCRLRPGRDALHYLRGGDEQRRRRPLPMDSHWPAARRHRRRRQPLETPSRCSRWTRSPASAGVAGTRSEPKSRCTGPACTAVPPPASCTLRQQQGGPGRAVELSDAPPPPPSRGADTGRTFQVGSQVEGCVATTSRSGLPRRGRRGHLDVGASRMRGRRKLIATFSRQGPSPSGGSLSSSTATGSGLPDRLDQGDKSYAVFRREGDNAYVGNLQVVAGRGIDGTEHRTGSGHDGRPRTVVRRGSRVQDGRTKGGAELQIRPLRRLPG